MHLSSSRIQNSLPGCWVLDTAYYQYRQQYKETITDVNNRYRYTAYRQLVRFVWGYLGKDIRVTLPSCAVTASERDSPVQMVPTQATWNLR
ncbi:hypothetical protein BaRGS_00032607 [Batillaria attramentaria]|uniref:Uncharacterized protein n=1 Tax=Batillaria attramentaria TaxID=370345 RepID=A0ABD0JMB4_9CAEN